jgi:hypothetical protein
MEAAAFSETLIAIYQTTWRHITEPHNLVHGVNDDYTSRKVKRGKVVPVLN